MFMIPATKSAIPEMISKMPETASRVVPTDSFVSFEAPIKLITSPAPPTKAAISEMISALKIFFTPFAAFGNFMFFSP